MSETAAPSSRIDQIVTEILQQQKRYEGRLFDTPDYRKRHTIVRTLDWFHKDLIKFAEFRTRLEATIPPEQPKQPASSITQTPSVAPPAPSQPIPETETPTTQPEAISVLPVLKEPENLPLEEQITANIRAERLLLQDFGLLPSEPELEETTGQGTTPAPETNSQPDSGGATNNPFARQIENVLLSRAYCLLGAVNFALENYDVSLQNYNLALKLNPKEAKGYDGVAQHYYKNGDYKTAIIISAQAIALDPNEVEGYTGHALALLALKNYSAAIEDFKKAIGLEPAVSSYFAYLGYIYFMSATSAKTTNQKLYFYRESITAYNRALEVDPTSLNSLISRGQAFVQLKKYGSALADFEQANKLDPLNATKPITIFSSVKPISGWMLAGVMALCTVFYSLPLLLSGLDNFVKIPLLLVLIWILLISVCLCSKLGLKDIGLQVKNLTTGVILIGLTMLLYQVLGKVFNVFTNDGNIFQPQGTSFFYTFGEVIRDLVVGTLPVVITQEILFRGFLTPQIFLKLKGPYRFGGTLVIASNYAALLQFLFITSTGNYDMSNQVFFFELMINSYLVTSIYLLTRNLYWCIGISFLLFSNLSTVLELINSICIFIVAVILMAGLSFYKLRNPSKNPNEITFNDTVDHDKRLENYLVTHPIVFLQVLIAGSLVLLVIFWGFDLISKAYGSSLTDNIIFVLIFACPWLVLVPEVVTRFLAIPNRSKRQNSFPG